MQSIFKQPCSFAQSLSKVKSHKEKSCDTTTSIKFPLSCTIVSFPVQNLDDYEGMMDWIIKFVFKILGSVSYKFPRRKSNQTF